MDLVINLWMGEDRNSFPLKCTFTSFWIKNPRRLLNFEIVRHGAYYRAALIRVRHLFQS